MATATGTHVKFVKVKTKQQYNDYTDKDGALIFVENERKIYVDGVAYGFSDSDVANKFLELTGGTMSGNIDMDFNRINGLSQLTFMDPMLSTSEIYTAHDERGNVLKINAQAIEFITEKISGIPNPIHDDDASNKKYVDDEVGNIVDQIGEANGIATLDEGGKVPSSQLPSYVDDVLEYPKRADFPATGETGKLYVAIDTGAIWRWSGSAYVEISAGSGALQLGTTSSTAYRGDRGKTAYDHSQLKGTNDNPHNITKSNVGLGSVQNYAIATQAEAEAGTSGAKYMTPQRTKQAIEKLAPRLAWEVEA